MPGRRVLQGRAVPADLLAAVLKLQALRAVRAGSRPQGAEGRVAAQPPAVLAAALWRFLLLADLPLAADQVGAAGQVMAVDQVVVADEVVAVTDKSCIFCGRKNRLQSFFLMGPA